jgi:hypothetical protein
MQNIIKQSKLFSNQQNERFFTYGKRKYSCHIQVTPSQAHISLGFEFTVLKSIVSLTQLTISVCDLEGKAPQGDYVKGCQCASSKISL